MVKKLFALLTVGLLLATLPASAAKEKTIKKKKLQIVFLMGQSNMVGLAEPRTAWYLTQPQYIPPRERATKKTRFFDWNFYWSGVRYYKGSEENKKKLNDLIMERRASRAKWRQRKGGSHGPWKTEEWGPKPKGGRKNMYPFLDRKAEEEGIYKRMAEILDAEDNEFNVDAAYDEVIKRDKLIAEDLKRVRELYLKGSKGEDFDKLAEAVAKAVEEKKLIRDLRKEFKAPDMPVVVGTLGMVDCVLAIIDNREESWWVIQKALRASIMFPVAPGISGVMNSSALGRKHGGNRRRGR